MADTLRIEDEDGFATEWPWPEDRLILANGDFVEIMERQHDERRAEWLAGGSDA